MSSIVLELQRDALNEAVSTSSLLRKALVVARKLSIPDTEEWLQNELNGYPEGEEVPEYRYIQGRIKVHNPYRGWMPLHFGNPSEAERLSRRGTRQSISELEDLGSGSALHMPYPPDVEQRLMDGMEIPLQPMLFVSASQVASIPQKVRNSVLEWALTLEQRGVLGEGMAFTSQEKEEAAGTVFNIENVIGTMSDSQIQQRNAGSTQSYEKSFDLESVRGVLGELAGRKAELRLPDAELAQLERHIEDVSRAVDAPNPAASTVREGLASIRSIVEGAAGSALFQGVLVALSALA